MASMQKTQMLRVGSKSERHASAVSGSDFYFKSVNVGSFTLSCVCMHVCAQFLVSGILLGGNTVIFSKSYSFILNNVQNLN